MFAVEVPHLTSAESTLFQITENFCTRSMAAPAKLLLLPVKVYANFLVVLFCPIPDVMYHVWHGMSSSDEDLDLVQYISLSFHFKFLSSIVYTWSKESTEKKDNNNNNAKWISTTENILCMAKLTRKLIQCYISWARDIIWQSHLSFGVQFEKWFDTLGKILFRSFVSCVETWNT